MPGLSGRSSAASRSLPGRVFVGKMDEVAVFDHTLSLGQITQLYSVATVP